MKKKIFTTRDINVDLSRPIKPFKQVTTKAVEVEYIDKDAPPVAPEGPMVTTKNIEDVQKKTKAENEKKKKDALKAKRREKGKKRRAEKKAKEGQKLGPSPTFATVDLDKNGTIKATKPTAPNEEEKREEENKKSGDK